MQGEVKAIRIGARGSRVLRLLVCAATAGGAFVVIFGVVVPFLGGAGPA